MEKGLHLPKQTTLNRICDVLDASWSQRKRLLSLAGYLGTLPIPGEDELQSAIRHMEPHFESVHYAVALEDMENTVWAVNDLEVSSFYGYPSKEKFIDECQGLSFIELLIRHEEFRKAWESLQAGHTQEDQVSFLNHQTVDIDHPQLGRYRIQLWYATLANDDRFKLVSHISDNMSTMQMFDNLYQYSTTTIPCENHGRKRNFCAFLV